MGQAAFQLAVMWVLVFQGAQLFHIPPASAATGASSLQNTIVFNAFVWMQLFNQVLTKLPLRCEKLPVLLLACSWLGRGQQADEQ